MRADFESFRKQGSTPQLVEQQQQQVSQNTPTPQGEQSVRSVKRRAPPLTEEGNLAEPESSSILLGIQQSISSLQLMVQQLAESMVALAARVTRIEAHMAPAGAKQIQGVNHGEQLN